MPGGGRCLAPSPTGRRPPDGDSGSDDGSCCSPYSTHMHACAPRQTGGGEGASSDDDTRASVSHYHCTQSDMAARSLGHATHARVRTAKSPRDTHRAKLPRNVTTSRRNVPGRPAPAPSSRTGPGKRHLSGRYGGRHQIKLPISSRYRRFSSGADRTRETDRPGGWAAVIWPARARHARVDETGYRTDRSPAAGRCCIASPCTWTLARDQVNVEAAAARAGVPCRLPTRPSHGHAWVPRPGGPAVALGVCPAPATSLEGGRRRAADGRPRPPPN